VIKMPKREWRKCETCEWWGSDNDCYEDESGVNNSLRKCRFRYQPINICMTFSDDWCSEWKNREIGTCGMCHWFPSSEMRQCRSQAGIVYGVGNGKTIREPDMTDGACEYFVRAER
jgi:hypothetical protein